METIHHRDRVTIQHKVTHHLSNSVCQWLLL